MTCRRAQSRGRVCGDAPLRRSSPSAATSLRCSGFGRAAKLASLAALVSLKQLRRVSLRSARDRAPTETLRSSPPHRRATAHPPTALRRTVSSLLGERVRAGHRARPAPSERACGARQAAGSMPAACLSPFPLSDRFCKAWGRPALGCVCDGEERSAGVGARPRALRDLTRRSCLSEVSAANVASSAARPQREYRSEPRAAGRRIRRPAPVGTKPCSHKHPASSRHESRVAQCTLEQ